MRRFCGVSGAARRHRFGWNRWGSWGWNRPTAAAEAVVAVAAAAAAPKAAAVVKVLLLLPVLLLLLLLFFEGRCCDEGLDGGGYIDRRPMPVPTPWASEGVSPMDDIRFCSFPVPHFQYEPPLPPPLDPSMHDIVPQNIHEICRLRRRVPGVASLPQSCDAPTPRDISLPQVVGIQPNAVHSGNKFYK